MSSAQTAERVQGSCELELMRCGKVEVPACGLGYRSIRAGSSILDVGCGSAPAADGNRLESVPLLDWPKNCYENVTACPDAALRPVVAYNPPRRHSAANASTEILGGIMAKHRSCGFLWLNFL